ncbi:rhomboid family protein, partial [Aphelenchoides avenae]
TSHLVHNVVGQFAFGTTLELAHRWRIAAVFLLGAITAALFKAALTDSHAGYGGGASGGVFAICAAHFANVTLNWNEMNHPIVHVALVMCFVAYTLFGIYRMGNTTSTSYSAHMGGFVAGILLGTLFLRNVVKEKWEAKVKKTALILYIVLVVFCVGGIVYRATVTSAIKVVSSN